MLGTVQIRARGSICHFGQPGEPGGQERGIGLGMNGYTSGASYKPCVPTLLSRHPRAASSPCNDERCVHRTDCQGNRLELLQKEESEASYQLVIVHHKTSKYDQGWARTIRIPGSLEPLLRIYLERARPVLVLENRYPPNTLLVTKSGASIDKSRLVTLWQQVQREHCAPWAQYLTPKSARYLFGEHLVETVAEKVCQGVHATAEGFTYVMGNSPRMVTKHYSRQKFETIVAAACELVTKWRVESVRLIQAEALGREEEGEGVEVDIAGLAGESTPERIQGSVRLTGRWHATAAPTRGGPGPRAKGAGGPLSAAVALLGSRARPTVSRQQEQQEQARQMEEDEPEEEVLMEDDQDEEDEPEEEVLMEDDEDEEDDHQQLSPLDEEWGQELWRGSGNGGRIDQPPFLDPVLESVGLSSSAIAAVQSRKSGGCLDGGSMAMPILKQRKQQHSSLAASQSLLHSEGQPNVSGGGAAKKRPWNSISLSKQQCGGGYFRTQLTQLQQAKHPTALEGLGGPGMGPWSSSVKQPYASPPAIPDTSVRKDGLGGQYGSQSDDFQSAGEDDIEGMSGGLCEARVAGANPRLELKRRWDPPESVGLDRKHEEKVEVVVEPPLKQGIRGWLARIFKGS